MQVILTEQEYLKLKNQSDEDKKAYVKRIDVSIALQEMVKEISSCRSIYDPITFQERGSDWKPIIDRFFEKIN